MKRHVYSEVPGMQRHGPRNNPSVEETQLGEEEGLWKYLGNEGVCCPKKSLLPLLRKGQKAIISCDILTTDRRNHFDWLLHPFKSN